MRSTPLLLVLLLSFALVALSSPAATTTTSKTSKSAKALAAEDNPDDPTGKTFYVSEPACGSFRCVVTWPKGLLVAVNWLNPTGKTVDVTLASNTGGSTYTIASGFSATTSDCDAGSGPGVKVSGVTCGRLEFVVPNEWENALNYTIVVQSLQSSDVGYTDAISIVAANSTTSSHTTSGISLVTAYPSSTAVATVVSTASGTGKGASSSSSLTGKGAASTSSSAHSSSTSSTSTSVAGSVAAASAAAHSSGVRSVMGTWGLTFLVVCATFFLAF
ncbi:hypothetical protein T439DRAFT_328836 [Meredithblackwellia eburnea MCA 4105]